MSWEVGLSKRHGHRASYVPVVLALLLVAGCGSSEPFDYVKVSGKVTYEDGSLIPVDRITVTFVSQAAPTDPKTHPRPGLAEVNVADGTFDVMTSHTYGDGVVRGRHKVLIAAPDSHGNPTAPVPPEYANAEQTPLNVDTADAPFYFKVRKPQ